MTQNTFAEELGEFVIDTNYASIPHDVIEQAKLSLLDNLGVMIRGNTTESAAAVRRVVHQSGGKPQSTLALTGGRVSALDAALVNGTGSHSLELDDHISHARSMGHPGVVSVPPALALSELLHGDGKTFLASMIMGYEVTSRLNDTVPPSFENVHRGFHGTAITGTFGAAGLSGRLLGMTPDEVATAIGIAGSLTSGSTEFSASGAWTKRLHAGQSSRNGMLAAYLAREGFTGPHTAIEGDRGFLYAYMGEGNYDASKITVDLGEDWALRHMMYKPFACSGMLHAPLSAAERIRAESGVAPDDIARIVVHTASGMVRLTGEPLERKMAPATGVDAQFSLPFTVATVLCRGRALLEEFSDEAIHDAQVLGLTRKVEMYVDPEIEAEWPNSEPSHVEIWTHDGQHFEAKVPGPKGGMEVPLSPAELETKFRELVQPVMGQDAVEQIVSYVSDIEESADVSELADLIVAPDYSPASGRGGQDTRQSSTSAHH